MDFLVCLFVWIVLLGGLAGIVAIFFPDFADKWF